MTLWLPETEAALAQGKGDDRGTRALALVRDFTPKTVTRAPRGWDTTLGVEPPPVFWYDTSRVRPGRAISTTEERS